MRKIRRGIEKQKKRKVDFDGNDLVDALGKVSERISKLVITRKDNCNRLTFQIHKLEKEVAWQTKVMAEFYEHLGFIPTDPYFYP